MDAMRYQFDNCELRVESHEVFVDGAPTEVEPQVFDLLKLFLENAGELISHEKLIDTIWGGRIVSDSAIGARISAARNVIGDDGARQKFIKTVPRRGFRFTAEVTATDSPGATPVSRTGVASQNPPQKVRFCRSFDGTQIAFANTGSGYPMVRAGHWLTHLEHDWHSPVW